MPHHRVVSFPLRPSRILTLALVAAHAAAAVAVLAATIPNELAAILLLLIGASAARQRRLDFPTHLSLHSNGRFSFANGTGETMPAIAVDPSSTLIGPLVVLRYTLGGRLLSTVLVADCFSSIDDRRGFCRWFRWSR